MEPIETAQLGLSWPIYLIAVVLLLGAWRAVRHWRHGASVKKDAALSTAKPLQAPPTLVYTDAPTIRLGDVQRMNRLHRVVSLNVGEHVDLLEFTFDHIPRLRVALVAIEKKNNENTATDDHNATQEYARIQVELGGGVAGCGSLVKEVGTNQFLVPCATPDEQRSSILHFDGKGNAAGFLRIKVLRFNAMGQSVEVDVLQVCGHWAA